MKIKQIFFSVLLITIFSFSGGQPQTYAASTIIELSGGVLENGRTLIPMRALFETLGAKVVWDSKKKTVTATKDNTVIKLTIDSKKVQVDGKTITLDTAPKVIKSQTMVPVRFVSETLGANVKWDAKTSTVSVVTNDQTIKIKVESPQVKLNINEIKEIILSAEKRLFSVVSADSEKQDNNTLTNSDITASKKKMSGVYTEKYLDPVWNAIYSGYIGEAWFINILYSSVTDSYIISQTNDKIVVYYALDNDVDGEYSVEYTLIKQDGNWLIDNIEYNV